MHGRCPEVEIYKYCDVYRIFFNNKQVTDIDDSNIRYITGKKVKGGYYQISSTTCTYSSVIL